MCVNPLTCSSQRHRPIRTKEDAAVAAVVVAVAAAAPVAVAPAAVAVTRRVRNGRLE